MSEENKAIEGIKNHLNEILNEYGKGAINSASCYLNSDIKKLLNLIEKQQQEIELKDKVIDEMAKAIDSYDVSFYINHYKNIEHIKEVFTNKIKENKE